MPIVEPCQGGSSPLLLRHVEQLRSAGSAQVFPCVVIEIRYRLVAGFFFRNLLIGLLLA